MKIIIIEDEPLAAERLEQLVKRYDTHFEVLAIIDCVEEAVAWFKEKGMPDLAFMDIQLADGLSFEIFDKVKVSCPVIFATAYDQYAVKAFKVNSVDYLLKPFGFDEVAAALDKYANLHLRPVVQKMNVNTDMIQSLLGQMRQSKSYKSRFVVRRGEQLVSVPVEDIIYFYSEDKSTLMRTADGKRYVVDYTLGDLDELLDPKDFFRINRGFTTRYSAIEAIVPFSQSRLQLRIKHCENPELVSKGRAAEFREWIDQ